jgi:uncharacterized peroxidase-related enzyme
VGLVAGDVARFSRSCDEGALLVFRNRRESAGLSRREVALLDFAVKLTRHPSEMHRDDLDVLREQGFRDEQLVDAVQCISYFNFVNRVLDGLGVDPEPSMRYGKESA